MAEIGSILRVGAGRVRRSAILYGRYRPTTVIGEERPSRRSFRGCGMGAVISGVALSLSLLPLV